MGIGVISDKDPQPLNFESKFGAFAICCAGLVDNKDVLADELIKKGIPSIKGKSTRCTVIKSLSLILAETCLELNIQYEPAATIRTKTNKTSHFRDVI
jgi:hypothetical protein